MNGSQVLVLKVFVIWDDGLPYYENSSGVERFASMDEARVFVGKNPHWDYIVIEGVEVDAGQEPQRRW